MKAIAVIGANFGDEGKGRIVDHFAAFGKSPVVVIRYNGGAQAGHTVVSPDGKRHIFSHFGSGSFVGATTYLSRYFIGNPILFEKELDSLLNAGLQLTVVANPDMPISTPYDMLLNREFESNRGAARHGSCGYGVSETVERLCNTPYKLFLSDIIKKNHKNTVMQIRDKHVPARLRAYGITNPSGDFMAAWKSDDLLERYFASIDRMVKTVNVSSSVCLKKYSTIIFEGAQGLGLDERHKYFPHVTRSKTGIDNVESICKEIGVGGVSVVYVTRAYLTRHGAGPLPTEDSSLRYDDASNVENDWQGKLRFGCLDVDLMAENIKSDRKRTTIKTDRTVAVTCFDQVPEDVAVRVNNRVIRIHKDTLPNTILNATGISNIIVSKSNHRN